MDITVSFFCAYEAINHKILTKLLLQMTTLIGLIIYGAIKA